MDALELPFMFSESSIILETMLELELSETPEQYDAFMRDTALPNRIAEEQASEYAVLDICLHADMLSDSVASVSMQLYLPVPFSISHSGIERDEFELSSVQVYLDCGLLMPEHARGFEVREAMLE